MNHAAATRSASTGSTLISRSLVTNSTQPQPLSQKDNNKDKDKDPREKFRSDSAWIRRPSSQSDPPQLGTSTSSNQDHQPSTESKDPVGVGENSRGGGNGISNSNSSGSSSSKNGSGNENGNSSSGLRSSHGEKEKTTRGDVFVRPLSRMRPPAGKPAATWNEVTDIDDIEDNGDEDEDDDEDYAKRSEGKEEKGEGKHNVDGSGRNMGHQGTRIQGKPQHQQKQKQQQQKQQQAKESKDDDDDDGLSGVDQWDAMVPVANHPRDSHR